MGKKTETIEEFYAHGDRLIVRAKLHGKRSSEDVEVVMDSDYHEGSGGVNKYAEVSTSSSQLFDIAELFATGGICLGVDANNVVAQALPASTSVIVEATLVDETNITIGTETKTLHEWHDDGVGFLCDVQPFYISQDTRISCPYDDKWIVDGEETKKFFIDDAWKTLNEAHSLNMTIQNQEPTDLWNSNGEKIEGFVVRYVEGNADGFNDDFYCTPTGGYEGVEALEGAGYSLTEPVVSYMYIYTNPSADETTPITIGQYDYRQVYKEDGSPFKFDRISSYGEKASTFNLEERDYTGAWKPTDSVNPWFPLYLYGGGQLGMKDSGIQRPVYALRFKQPEISDDYYYLYLNKDGAFFETCTAGMQNYHDVYDAEGNVPNIRETYGNLDEQEDAAYFDGTTWRTDFWMRYIRLEFSSSLHRLYLEQTIKFSAIRWKKPAKPRPVDDSLTLICYLNSNKTAVSFSSNDYWFAILDYEQLEAAQEFGVGLDADLVIYEPNKFDYEVVDGLYSDDLATNLVYSDLSNLRVGSARRDMSYAVAILNIDSITTKSKTWKLKITRKPDSEEHIAYFNSGVGNDTKNVTSSWGTTYSILGSLYPKDSSEGIPYDANKTYMANEIFWADGTPTELTAADVNINDKNWQGVSIGTLCLWSRSAKTAGYKPCGIKYGVSKKAPTTYYFWHGEPITIPQDAQYNDPYGQSYTAIYLGTGTETLSFDTANAYEIMGFDGDEVLPADLNKFRIVSGSSSILGNKKIYNNGSAWLSLFGALSKEYTFNNISIRVRPRVLHSCIVGSSTWHEETVSSGQLVQLYDSSTGQPLEYNGPDLPLELFNGMCTYRKSISDSSWYNADYTQFTLLSGGLLRIESNYSGKLYAFRIKL